MLTCPFTANPVKSKLMSSCLLHRSVFPSINSSTSLGAKCVNTKGLLEIHNMVL